MDTQDQGKTASGLENHVCHKCGWPFPKAHPSSKQRRAHKRICGTIEGYKLSGAGEQFYSTVSDDENPSDEDLRTPSPKIVKRSFSGSGIGGKSNRSEDEVFSDAVTDFSDSGFSPGTEESLEVVKELDKNVEKTAEGDLSTVQLLEVDAIADSAVRQSSAAETSEAANAEVLENAGSNTIPFEDSRTKEVVAAISMNLSPREFSLLESETCAHVTRENSDENFGDDGMQYLTAHIRQEIDVKENTDEVGEFLMNDVQHPSATISKSSHSMPADGFVESKQGQSDDFVPEISVCDLSPQSKSDEPMEASVNNIQIITAPVEEIDTACRDGLVKISDTKMGIKESLPFSSVTSDLPVVDQADVMIEGFKGHETLKFNIPQIIGSVDVVKPPEADNKGMIFEENPSLHSYNAGGSCSPSADASDMEDYLIKGTEENKRRIEVPEEGVCGTSKFNAPGGEVLEYLGLECPPGSSWSEKEKTQTNCDLQGVQPNSDASPVVSSVDYEVDHTTKSSEGDIDDPHKIALVQQFVTNGLEVDKGVILHKEIPANTNADFTIKDSHLTMNLVGGDDIDEHGEAKLELSVLAQSECVEPAVADHAMSSIIKLEPMLWLSDSTRFVSITDTTIADFDISDSTNMTQTPTNSKKCPDKDSQPRKEPEISSDTKVTECVSAENMASKPSHCGFIEVLDVNSQSLILKEPGSLPLHSEFTHGNSPEGDDTLKKQHCGVSAVDISVDSSSQTDSVEGNWGSVSVVSAQSGAPTSANAEALPSTEPQGPGKTEKLNLQKSKTPSERQQPDKADVFEPPSFLTMVESRDKVDQKAADSEIETVQSNQQPNSEALQAAWFPSLNNVINESQGRKKNEERIVKVTNWSTGKQHTPLKNLLGEANVESKLDPKRATTSAQNDETAGKGNGTIATTVKEVLGSEAPGCEAANIETAKEWNSPAKFPVEIKKERRKVKAKPAWLPFVCCSSVN